MIEDVEQIAQPLADALIEAGARLQLRVARFDSRCAECFSKIPAGARFFALICRIDAVADIVWHPAPHLRSRKAKVVHRLCSDCGLPFEQASQETRWDNAT
jgi:hypothetical protein